MKTRIGMSLGLALTLMVGVFATMLALGLFTTTEVGAQATASATRSFTPPIGGPGRNGDGDHRSYELRGSRRVTETVPAGFTYGSSSIDDLADSQ